LKNRAEDVLIREMAFDDHEQMIKLWKDIKGIGLSNADSKANINQFLKRNQGLSFVCVDNKEIVGTILCGHDGRRGYLYHLAVAEEFRHQGIGNKLVTQALDKLHSENIDKCHLFLYNDNEPAMLFYRKTGWKKRDNLLIYSKDII
jgi:N-acetylglutamate synthase